MVAGGSKRLSNRCKTIPLQDYLNLFLGHGTSLFGHLRVDYHSYIAIVIRASYRSEVERRRGGQTTKNYILGGNAECNAVIRIPTRLQFSNVLIQIENI
jgi:hypothetical protein